MTLSEKIFALKSISPFDELRDSEITLIAQEARVRSYGPGEIVSNAERPIRRLHIVTQGEVRPTGSPLSGGEGSAERSLPIFGVKPLLFNRDGHTELVAGSEGATCLTIKRGNLFTIANECPGLVVGFLSLAEQGQLL